MERKRTGKKYTIIFCVGCLAFLATWGLRQGGFLEFFELAAYDGFVRLVPKQKEQSPWVTLIEITDRDIQKIGHWPLTDADIAQGLDVILNAGPRAVGLDIYRDIPVPPGREALNRLFLDNPEVIGVMNVGEEGIAPLPAIEGTPQAAFGDILSDRDGTVRRGLLFLDDGTNVFASFALTLTSIYLAEEGIFLQPAPENPNHVRLNETTIVPLEKNDGGYRNTDAGGYQFLLDYKNTGTELHAYPFSDLIAGKVPAELLSQRIVLIGVRAESVKDAFVTPLSLHGTQSELMSGIDLHGQIICQLLRFALEDAAPIRTPQAAVKNIWLFLWGLVGATCGLGSQSIRKFILLLCSGVAILALSTYAAFSVHWWIPLIPPLIAYALAGSGVTVYLTRQERKDRAALMQIFSQHVSKEVAGMLWEQRDHFLDNGRPRSEDMTITVLFSDIRGFTSVSEKMPPDQLIAWLNEYMEAMAGIIMKYGGVIDSYAGDGIKADFGVPIPRKTPKDIRSDAINAVLCALEMQQAVESLNTRLEQSSLPEIGIRVGIFTGKAVGGLLGSSKRLKYTTIGDTVNIASRLENYDKSYDQDSLCRILIGESTLNELGSGFETREVGDFALKGKEQVTKIYQVLGKRLSESSH